MKKNILLILILSSIQVFSQETLHFKSLDGIEITGDLYLSNKAEAPFIILFHQAGWSRGEYLEIAPQLNGLGYNCLAVDARSGKGINNINNQTHLNAISQKKETSYIDALQDLNATINFVQKEYKQASKIIIWGSSYSSALVLKIAGERNDVDAVLSFAPGEYFEQLGKPADYITRAAKHINIPVFITSAKNEKNNWWKIYEVIPSKRKQFFLPETNGQHGARALWSKFPEHKLYWEAVTKFLNSIK